MSKTEMRSLFSCNKNVCPIELSFVSIDSIFAFFSRLPAVLAAAVVPSAAAVVAHAAVVVAPTTAVVASAAAVEPSTPVVTSEEVSVLGVDASSNTGKLFPF